MIGFITLVKFEFFSLEFKDRHQNEDHKNLIGLKSYIPDWYPVFL